MGFRKPLDFNAVYHQLYMTGVEIMSTKNDGFIQWQLKQDLYQIQSLIDTIINNSPVFEGEEAYLKERQQRKLVRILER